MRERSGVPFAELTTLRVGGPAARLVEVDDEGELLELLGGLGPVADPVEAAEALLVLGSGSNLLVSDAGFPGTTLAVRTSGIAVAGGPVEDGAVEVRLAAGEPWDEVVAWSVAEGLGGLETLAGIPGLAGATPIQNVGAYGTELSDVLVSVLAFDRRDARLQELPAAECGLTYRGSGFKASPGRWVVVAVTLRLTRDGRSRPVSYRELAARLGVAEGSRCPGPEVREAVLELRRGKAMVLDPVDHDTWSAGSFFTNPVVAGSVAATVPAEVARWPFADGVKLSAAGLLEAAGFGRGFAAPGGRAAVSSRHTLALTNRGGASAADVLGLARTLRDGVEARFGIRLEPEPTLVGLAL